MTTTVSTTSSPAGSTSPLREGMRVLTRVSAPLTTPLAGRRFFKLWGVIHHVGRRSGREYATPVALRATSDGFVIPLPWGPGTQWARNVVAAGSCRLRWNGADYSLIAPEIVPRSEAEDAFSRPLRIGLRVFGIESLLRVRVA